MSSQCLIYFISCYHCSLSYCFALCVSRSTITSTRGGFFAFIVHIQPLRCSMHVCVCMCGSSGNPFATSYGHDVLEVCCDLIAHCGIECRVFRCFVERRCAVCVDLAIFGPLAFPRTLVDISGLPKQLSLGASALRQS